MVVPSHQLRALLPLPFILVFILALLILPFPALADEAARKLREAETHFSRGDYLEALADYQDVLEQPGAGDHRAKALMMSAAIHSAFLKDPEAALGRRFS